MKDKISQERLDKLHPKAMQTFKKFIEDAENTLNIVLRITQGLRTITEQNELYAHGRTLSGLKVTNAKGGYSFHNYGLAIDVAQIIDGKANWSFDYKTLEPFAKKYGIEWGGNFKSIVDKPHFQISFGLTIEQLLKTKKDLNCLPIL